MQRAVHHHDGQRHVHSVEVEARPPLHGRILEGGLIGSMVDPNSHRMLVRSEIEDPTHELRSGMFPRL